jgi:hypothetical protein
VDGRDKPGHDDVGNSTFELKNSADPILSAQADAFERLADP